MKLEVLTLEVLIAVFAGLFIIAVLCAHFSQKRDSDKVLRALFVIFLDQVHRSNFDHRLVEAISQLHQQLMDELLEWDGCELSLLSRMQDLLYFHARSIQFSVGPFGAPWQDIVCQHTRQVNLDYSQEWPDLPGVMCWLDRQCYQIERGIAPCSSISAAGIFGLGCNNLQQQI